MSREGEPYKRRLVYKAVCKNFIPSKTVWVSSVSIQLLENFNISFKIYFILKSLFKVMSVSVVYEFLHNSVDAC